MIKPEYRDMVATGSPFGAEVPAPPDADDWERLAAFMGHNHGHRSTGSAANRKGTSPSYVSPSVSTKYGKATTAESAPLGRTYTQAT